MDPEKVEHLNEMGNVNISVQEQLRDLMEKIGGRFDGDDVGTLQEINEFYDAHQDDIHSTTKEGLASHLEETLEDGYTIKNANDYTTLQSMIALIGKIRNTHIDLPLTCEQFFEHGTRWWKRGDHISVRLRDENILDIYTSPFFFHNDPKNYKTSYLLVNNIFVEDIQMQDARDDTSDNNTSYATGLADIRSFIGEARGVQSQRELSQQNIDILTARTIELNNIITTLTTAQETLTLALRESHTQNNTLSQNIQSIEEQIQQLRREREECLNQTNNGMSRTPQSAPESPAVQSYQEAISKRDEIISQIQEKQAEITEKNARKSQLESEIAQMEISLSENVAGLTSDEKIRRETEIQAKRAELQNLQAELETLAGEIMRLQANLQQAENLVADLLHTVIPSVTDTADDSQDNPQPLASSLPSLQQDPSTSNILSNTANSRLPNGTVVAPSAGLNLPTLPPVIVEAKACIFDLDVAVRYNKVTWRNQPENVKNIQRVLGLIEDKNNPQNNQVDGFLGKITTQQVMEFQREHHLVPDGRIGPATIAEINARGPENIAKINESGRQPQLPPWQNLHWVEPPKRKTPRKPEEC